MDHMCQTGKEVQHLPPRQDKVTNAEVLSRAGLPSMYTLVRQRRLRWLGHVRRMEDVRIPKDILSGELATGQRSIGRPHLRFKDVCNRDVRALDIDTESFMGRPSSWPRQLEKQHPPQTTKPGRRKADSDGRRATSSRKGFYQQTCNLTQIPLLRLRLSLSHWPFKPHATLLEPSWQPAMLYWF